MDGLAVRELHGDLDPELLARLYREVLEPAFSRDELEKMGPLASRLDVEGDPESLAAVVLDDDGEVLGGLVADLDRDCDVLLLSYLAVRPDARRRGIGRFMIERIAAQWYESENVKLAVAEVHDPRHWADHDAEALTRLRFYEGLGVQLLGTPFVQPALHEDSERVPGFLLLAFHVDPGVLRKQKGREGIPSELLSRFVRNYFEDAEGVKEPYDPELASLIDRIERDELVELIPVAEHEHVPPLAADA